MDKFLDTWHSYQFKYWSVNNSGYTLQLLVYYIMGMHSIHKEFKSIKNLGIYNPRMNKVYTIDIGTISKLVIVEVSKEVIGY